jgi:hypothetical protein
LKYFATCFCSALLRRYVLSSGGSVAAAEITHVTAWSP